MKMSMCQAKKKDEYVDVNKELMKLTPTISLNSIEGEFNPKTLRVTRNYKKESLHILIHSGSTFNFIKARVVKKLKLKTVPT